MRRLVAVVIVLALLIAGAMAALPFLVSTDSVRAQIVAKAELLTGRKMSFRQAPKVFFNPYLGIAIDSVIFEGPKWQDDDPPLAEMEELRGRVAILPALFGRVEVTHYQFVRPHFNLKVHEDGRLSWEFPNGQVWQLLEQARQRRQATETGAKVDLSGISKLALGQFEIIDGVINYENARTGVRRMITNFNARLDWPDSASAWTINGSAIWRDEALDFSIRTAQPLLLMAGGTSTATASIKSGAFEFTFDGDANLLADLHLAGAASMSAPSLSRLVNLFGGKMEARSSPWQFSAKGKINGTPKQVQLSDADITLDGNRGRGVLQLALGEINRLQINATLAFKSFDFSPYLAGFLQEAEINRPELSIVKLIDKFDTDIRLSASEAKAGSVSLTNLAAALSVRNSELLFDVGNATVHGGTATGMMTIKKEGNGAAFASQANLSGVALGQALAALQPEGKLRPTTPADIQFSARSTGNSARELIDRLRGEATLKTGTGVLTGVALNRLVAPAGKEDDDGVIALSGETGFNSMSGNFFFATGVVWIRGFELVTSDVEARFNGRADLASGGLALRVRLRDASAAAKPDALFFVGGVASSPLVTREREDPDGLDPQ